MHELGCRGASESATVDTACWLTCGLSGGGSDQGPRHTEFSVDRLAGIRCTDKRPLLNTRALSKVSLKVAGMLPTVEGDVCPGGQEPGSTTSTATAINRRSFITHRGSCLNAPRAGTDLGSAPTDLPGTRNGSTFTPGRKGHGSASVLTTSPHLTLMNLERGRDLGAGASTEQGPRAEHSRVQKEWMK